MSFLTFNCDKSIIYIIVYWIIEITYLTLLWLKGSYFSLFQSNIQSEYMLFILLNFGDLLSGFLVLYIKQVSKSKHVKDDSISNNSKNQLIYVEYENFHKKISYKKLLIIILLDYLSKSILWIAYAFLSLTDYNEREISHHTKNDLITAVDIIIRYIIAIFIIKNILYRHKTLSILMIGIGLIILLVTDFLILGYYTNGKLISVTMIYFGMIFLKGIILPLEDMMIKKIFTENCILPASMQFLRGIMEFIILIITTPILYFSFNLTLDFDFNVGKIFMLIFFMIRGFVNSYITLKIIYQFSIQSVSFLIISATVGGSIKKIYDFNKNSDKDATFFILILFEIFGILIILFATLIYDELIIINKCKLNENVKLYIIDRGEKEIGEINDQVEPIMP